MQYDIIVIGAGAAGLMAAGTAAEAGASVLLLEANPKAGRKLMITGKGRCNLTNNTSLEFYLENINPLPKFCLPMFSRFFVKDTLRHFRNIVVPTIEERGRRIFPRSGRAMDVVDALVSWNTGSGVTIKYGRRVKQLLAGNGALTGVMLESGSVFSCECCILATGGRSYPLTGSTGDGYRMASEAGHRVIPPMPALVPLVTEGGVAGSMRDLVLKNVEATLYVKGKKQKSRFGELLFTEQGLSGPIILALSRDAVLALHRGLKTEICIDWQARPG
ncbi:MAG: aminoacetone oxidase family FAD-binding enzyme [Candidatus Marinimicrobia bacterium]|nr:aminoacetone oxidase family FAD-binding enzyme [Candidatus Neomarinimicrobiota bacterium]